MGHDPKKVKPKTVLSYIEDAKNNIVSYEDYSLTYSGFFEDIVNEVYELYQKRLKEIDSVDFGDLLFYVVTILKKDKDLLKKYQDKFKHIMVDEYQDTNKVQYDLIKLLAGEEQNLCVVGDDDQSIYKWRGADIKNILYFQRDFPSVKIVKLEQNYRSTANVINAAVSVIHKNNERVEKSLWTEKGEGEKISIYQAEDENDEALFVTDEIFDMLGEGRNMSEIAVLYRTNYQSRAIEEAMLKRNIPYKLVGGFRFYDRKEVKDLVSYLRFVTNPKDYMSLLRIINTPARKMGSKSISNLAKISKEAGATMGELIISEYWRTHSDLSDSKVNPVVIKYLENNRSIDAFANVVELFGSLFFACVDLSASDSIKYIAKKIKYIEYLDDGSEAADMKKENITELENVASGYGEAADSKKEFLEGVALIENEVNKNSKQTNEQNRVTLMTLHASKGLEFPVVFMIGMEEGLLPHSRSFSEIADLEEERRLCYVGITRAREKLYMTFAESRMTGGDNPFGRVPSRCLGEIPQEICEYYSWNA